MANVSDAVVTPRANTAISNKRRKKPNNSSYSSYIYRVLKHISPETGISSKSMGIMDSFCKDMFERICDEASRVARYNKKHTITAKTIQTACSLILPGELGKHSISEGNKAVSRFVEN